MLIVYSVSYLVLISALTLLGYWEFNRTRHGAVLFYFIDRGAIRSRRVSGDVAPFMRSYS